MMKFGRLIADRKGVAVEMAIVVMVVSFALSVMLTTTSLLQYNKQKIATHELAQTVALEQIGESFCSAVANGEGTDWITLYPDYDIVVSGANLTVRARGREEILLQVVLYQDGVSGETQVTVWKTY